MPPRLPACYSAQRSGSFKNALIKTQGTASAAGQPSQPSPGASSLWVAPSSAPFSTTAPRELAFHRRRFLRWLATEGENYKHKKPDQKPGPVYLTKFGAQHSNATQPFLHNPEFVSQPVLSESARESIWKDVMERGLPLKAVSARRNVDMLRVAAVLRMKTIEKKWAYEGKQLAESYSATMLNMLPSHNLEDTESPFESINDVYVHSRTQQQLFVPTSESRHFTREDAAKAFGDSVLPPDKKIRIPELIAFEKELASGVNSREARFNFLREVSDSERELAAKIARQREKEEQNRLRVSSGRFEFRIENVNADAVGKNGRSRSAFGWRYGVPHGDRRRGAIKIPTKVG